MDNKHQRKGGVMRIKGRNFFKAPEGTELVGKNSLTWKIEAVGNNGGMLCKSPHTGEKEEIFLRGGMLRDEDGHPIEEFEGGIKGYIRGK